MDWTVAYQVPLSMEFSRQEYQNGFPFSNPADLPDPEVESTSPLSPGLVGGFIYHCDTWEAQSVVTAPEKKTLMLLNKKGEYLSFKEGKEAWREKRKDGRNTRNSHETIFSILEP